jgi:hypothetical protein
MSEITERFRINTPRKMTVRFVIAGHINGTKDHEKLYNRDLPDQHPISAITDLEDTLDGKQDSLTTEQTNAVDSGITADKVSSYDNHIANKNNPHEVTKAQIGLGNVDNTSDINKPISSATQTALDGKQATITGGASSIVSSNLTQNRALVSNNSGKVEASEITSTELGYLDGAEGNIQQQIDNLKSRGRFLSLWNCATGLAQSTPTSLPYEYKTGDYFIVGTVGTTNYKPSGNQYTGVASTVVETNTVKVNDTFYYDGTNWMLQVNAEREVSFSSIVGNPEDNVALKNDLDDKYDVSNPAGYITISSVPTKVSQLQNDSGFTTNTGTVTSVRVQAGTGLTSSQSTAQSQTLDTTIGIDSNHKLPTNTEWDGKESYPTTVTVSTASVSLAVEGNKNYVLNNAEITDITISSCETSYQETTIQITTGATAPTFTDSSGITWVDGSAPILQANMNYIILIWNKKGFVREY